MSETFSTKLPFNIDSASGGITLLLADNVPGLQVFDTYIGEWVGVTPNANAYVSSLSKLLTKILISRADHQPR